MLLTLLALAAEEPVNPCAAVPPVRTSVAEIKADPQRYLRRCVVVTAWGYRGILFADRDAMERRVDADDWRLSEEEQAAQMGVYSVEHSDEIRALEEQPMQWTVTGVVDICERISEAAHRSVEDQPASNQTFVWVSIPGYCHYWSGPVILTTRAVPRTSTSS